MKKQVLIAFAVGLCMTVNIWAQVPSYVPTNGLVGWWPFNGNANDESGNGNNGTVNGPVLSTDRFGNTDKAYSFVIYDYIQSSPNLPLSNSSRSVSLWFQINNNYTNCMLSYGQELNGRKYSIMSQSAYPTATAYGRPYISCEYNDYAGSINITDGTWHNLVVVYATQNFSLYLDGILFSTFSSFNMFSDASVSSIITSNSSLFFGKSVNNNPEYFEGKLDDIGIWNRALTECEIQNLYNSQLNSISGSISVSPQSSTIGSAVTLSSTSTSQNLQWQTNGVNLGWQNVPSNTTYSGGNTNMLTVNNLQLSNHNQPFRVIANTGNCTDTSNVTTIQITDTCITTIYDTLYTTVTDTLIINTTLSLPSPNNENTILIYPNPASDHITIDNGNFSAMAGYTIKIENNAGQQVFQSAINQAQFYVDLSTWTGNGLYFVHLIDPQNNTVTVRKIVLQ
jgi:hypothetical protein